MLDPQEQSQKPEEFSWIPPEKFLGATTPDYPSMAREAAKRHRVDPNIFERQIAHESVNYNPDVVAGRRKSPKGATGIAQFMPDTASRYGLGVSDLADPEKSLDAAARHMRDLLDETGDDYEGALAGYNAGIGRVRDNSWRNIPETRNYTSKILGAASSKSFNWIDPDSFLANAGTPFAGAVADARGVTTGAGTPSAQPALTLTPRRRVGLPEERALLRDFSGEDIGADAPAAAPADRDLASRRQLRSATQERGRLRVARFAGGAEFAGTDVPRDVHRYQTDDFLSRPTVPTAQQQPARSKYSRPALPAADSAEERERALLYDFSGEDVSDAPVPTAQRVPARSRYSRWTPPTEAIANNVVAEPPGEFNYAQAKEREAARLQREREGPSVSVLTGKPVTPHLRSQQGEGGGSRLKPGEAPNVAFERAMTPGPITDIPKAFLQGVTGATLDVAAYIADISGDTPASQAVRGLLEEIRGGVTQALPLEKPESFWTSDIPQAAGSSVPFLAASALAPEAIAARVVAGLGAAQNGHQVYDEARKAGRSHEEALQASIYGALIGTTERFGLGSVGSRVGTMPLLEAIKREALEEGGQETLQAFLNNATARGFYDPNRPLDQDVVKNAVIGAITGGAMGGGAHAGTRLLSRRTQQPDAASALAQAPSEPGAGPFLPSERPVGPSGSYSPESIRTQGGPESPLETQSGPSIIRTPLGKVAELPETQGSLTAHGSAGPSPTGPALSSIIHTPLTKTIDPEVVRGEVEQEIAAHGTPALWRAPEGDIPVSVIGDLGVGADGRHYVKVAGYEGGIPVDELAGAPARNPQIAASDIAGIPTPDEAANQAAALRTPEDARRTITPPDVSPGVRVPETVPERPEALTAQLEALRRARSDRKLAFGPEMEENTSRKAVLATPGEKLPATKGSLESEGFAVTRAVDASGQPVGTFIHDPREVSRQEVKRKAADGTFHELLGIIEKKSPATTEAVVARGTRGEELQAAMASPQNVEAQANALRSQFPESTISVERPGDVIAGRQPISPTDAQRAEAESRAAEYRKRGRYGDAAEPYVPPTLSPGGWQQEIERSQSPEYDAGARSKQAMPVDVAAHEAATSPYNDLPQPTDAQIKAGVYKKGHVRIGGLDVAIENPQGSQRRPEWPPLKSHYGHVKRTEGRDGEPIDVFVKPGTPANYSGPVFVVDQQKANGAFDEHKIMLGWPDEASARTGYAENFTPGWRVGPIRSFASVDEFRDWLKTADTTKPAAGAQIARDEGENETPPMGEPLHHSELQPRTDEGKFDGPPEYPKEDVRGAATRRASAYDRLVALRRENQDRLFQDSPSEEHRIVADVIDEFAKEGIRDFKTAVEKFHQEFGPSSEYAEIFEAAWDANKNVKKRGKATFESATEPAQSVKRETLTDAVIRLGRLKSTGYSGGGEKRMLSVKEGGRPGLFSDKGLAPEDMMRTLEGEGFSFDDDLNKFNDALRDEAGGVPHYSDAAAVEAGSEEVEREWERMRQEEFAQNSDHSIMARAFDNSESEEYKPWVEAYDRIYETPDAEDFTVFSEFSRDLGLSNETINRLIAEANRHREAQEGRDRRVQGYARSGSTVATDAASFKQGLVDHFHYSDEAAEATTAVADALIDTLANESGHSKESLYSRLWLTSGGKAQGLEQRALPSGDAKKESQRIGIFNKEGKLVGTASLSMRSDPAKWVEENYGKDYDFGPLTLELRQGARGMTSFLKTGEAVIRALQNPNESTGVHEIHHATLPMFMNLAGQPGVSGQLGKDMDHMAEWMGFEDAAEFNRLHDRYVKGTLKGDGLKRYVEGQEKGARGFEKYLRTGKAPTSALASAFAKFKEWLSRIYQNLKSALIDIPFTQQQIGIWDRMLGGKGESGPKVTSIKNAVTEAERAERGLDPVEQSLRRGFGQVLDEGKALVDRNPYFRETTVADLIENPRAPSDAEDAALAYDRMKLYNEHRAALREMGEAVERDDGTGVFDAERKLAAIEQAIDLNDQAAKISGTESGRSLNARKLMIRADYSLAAMLQKAKAAARETGKEVSPELREQIEEMAERISFFESKLDAREKYITELEARTAQEEKVSNWRAAGKKRPSRSKAVLDDELIRMQQHFALLARGGEPGPVAKSERGGGGGLFQADKLNSYEGPFTDEMRKLIKDMARNRVEAGARSAENVNQQVHAIVSQYLPEVEAREVGDVWSEYGKTAKLSMEEIDVAMREAKRQQRLLAALEDAQAGESPLRSGLNRDKRTERVRELTRLVSTEMRKQGTQDVRSPEERWATALEAIKTNLRNSIADMTKRLETGEKPLKRVSTPLDVEAKALKAQRDALAQTLREIEGPRRLTDQERIQMGERGLEKSITDLDERIKSGQLSPKARTSAPWSAKISELQKQRKALADTLKAMRDAAKPPKDKDAALLKAFKTRTAKSISEYQRRLDEGDFTTTKRKPLDLDPEAQALAAKRDAFKAQYQRELESMRPGKRWRTLSGLRKAWMLSGVSTQTKNVLGTGLYQVFEELRRMPTAIADVALSAFTDRRAASGLSPAAALDSVSAMVRVGGREAKEILRHGATAEQMAAHQFGQEIDTGIKVIDASANAIFRFMSASDRIFYNQSLRRNLLDRASAQAKTERRTDKALDVKQRTKDLANNPSPELKASAQHDALVTTFNNSNRLSEAIKRGRGALSPGANFALDMVMPFDRTPTNVIARVLEASPYGYARNAKQIARWVVSREMTVEQQREFSETFGRATAGSAIMALGWYLASLGILTGLAPSPEDRKKDREAGLEPNSIKVGETWLPVGSLSPTGTIMTIGAGLYRETHREKTNWMKVAGTAFQPLTDQPLLRGANQAADFLRDPSRGGANVAGSFLYSFMPMGGAMRDLAKATDPAKRRFPSKEFTATGLKEQIQQNIPGWRKNLADSEEQERIERMVRKLPRPIAKETRLPVDTELGRLGIAFPFPQNEVTIGGVQQQMPQATFDEFQQRVAETFYEQLADMISKPFYKRFSDADKKIDIADFIKAWSGSEHRRLHGQQVVKAGAQGIERVEAEMEVLDAGLKEQELKDKELFSLERRIERSLHPRSKFQLGESPQ